MVATKLGPVEAAAPMEQCQHRRGMLLIDVLLQIKVECRQHIHRHGLLPVDDPLQIRVEHRHQCGLMLVDDHLWIRAESRHLIRCCCDGLNLVDEVLLLLGDLQHVCGNRGHLLDKRSNTSCISCMVVAIMMRIGRERWGVGDSSVNGEWL
jgi:hypothetical protein